MKICLHTQYYPPEFGAPQARLSSLARAFAGRGHEVTVLTAMPNYPGGRIHPGYGGLWRREAVEGSVVRRSFIYPTKSVGLARRLANYFSFVSSSAAVGASTLPRLDYLMTESPPLFLGPAGWSLAKLKRARWIFNVSDLWPESAVRLGVVGPGWGLRMAERIESFCYRHAWLITGQSREILGHIESRFPGVPTYHLSNGVDAAEIHPGLRSSAARAELLGETGADCVAIYVGLHGIAQGLGQVLEAADRLRDLDRLAIAFVGDGPERETLMGRARELGLDRVRFLGPRPKVEAASLLASADVALVPLGIPLVGAVPSKLYEAMGVGVPVALCAAGEAADIVRSTGAGIACPPGDPSALAEALRVLAGDPELRRSLGERGRDAAERRFDRGQIADSFINHLEDRIGCASVSSSVPARIS